MPEVFELWEGTVVGEGDGVNGGDATVKSGLRELNELFS